MDAVQLIEADHKKMRGLFERFKKAKSPDQQKSIMTEILVELKGHSEFEEQLVYPPARQTVGDELIDESEEEHHMADVLMMELAEMDAEDEKYEAKATVLEEMLLHHMEEEEKEMLPKLKKVQGDTFTNSDLPKRRKEFAKMAEEFIPGAAAKQPTKARSR